MLFTTPAFFAINDTDELRLFEDGTGFIFEGEKLLWDFHYEMSEHSMDIVLNDDASWARLTKEGECLQGVLYSHIAPLKKLKWSLLTQGSAKKPQAQNMLQAVRFQDFEALKAYEDKASKQKWSEMLIEASICGHEKMVELCLAKGAELSINEKYETDENASSIALIKAIQYGHTKMVKQLLNAGACVQHHSFDLDLDPFYHACFLYQVRPKQAKIIITMLLDKGVNLAWMSAYYMSAVMYVYPQGPLEKAVEDTDVLDQLLALGLRLDSFVTINAWTQDTACMFAAHMGLFEPLKHLVDAGANIFECFEGKNALDRLLSPIIHDPLMPQQNRDRIELYLRDLGLEQSVEEADGNNVLPELPEPKLEEIEALGNLFKNM